MCARRSAIGEALALAVLGGAATCSHGRASPADPPPAQHWAVSGCLLLSEEEQARIEPSRALKPSRVRFADVNGVLTMTHSFSHACCLKLDLTQQVDGAAFTVHEKLLGKPCRCMCDSEIEVVLPPATGTVTVETEWPPGRTRVAFTGPPRAE